MNESKIKQILRDAGVPLVDKNTIESSIQWLTLAYKYTLERERVIYKVFGLSVCHDKSGDGVFVLEYDPVKMKREDWDEVFDIPEPPH